MKDRIADLLNESWYAFCTGFKGVFMFLIVILDAVVGSAMIAITVFVIGRLFGVL